jgi:GR25 family glycosyltransferase involved in LPS biosynthesis
MQRDWDGILNLTRVDGVKSSKKYAGCALAHINAIRIGLEKAPYCIVLEDDVMPDSLTAESVKSFIHSVEHLFPALDAISLCPTFDRDINSQDTFIADGDLLVVNPTGLISGAAAMIYTRRILRSLPVYQSHISFSPWVIPNDRLFSTSSFGFFKYSPLQAAIPKHYLCKLSSTAKESDNFSGGTDVSKEKLSLLVKQSENKQLKNSSMHFYIYPKYHVLLLLILFLTIFLYGLNRILKL